MKKNIENFNDKGKYHGYQEWYIENSIRFRCNYKNGRNIGYIEWHNINFTIYNIK